MTCGGCQGLVIGRRSNARYCKPCSKERYLASKRQSRKARRVANPELVAQDRARTRNFHAVNRANPEYVENRKVTRRVRYATDPDYANRERQNAIDQNHKRRSGDSTRSKGILNQRIYEQNGKCYWCSTPFSETLKATIEHYVPLSKGGNDEDSNIVAACQSCNSSKSSSMPSDYAQRIGRLL